jgi:3-oxo-5,6-didehydrosuberyl-CoA/3-oxoadipyl-CoA thiolase
MFMLDTMWAGAGGPPNPKLLASDAYIEMMQTAQKLAAKYEIPREEIDAFALRSHRRAAAARDSGRFAKEIMPVEVSAGRKQPPRTFEHDEGIRDDTTAEKLAALPPQPGTELMTAGNASQLSDGASAIVLASAERAAELGVRPLARVVAAASVGVDPTIMGIGPAYAIPKAIERAGIEPEQVDLFEIHEAFAAQVLAVLRELPFDVPDSKLNHNGGAVALGHPFGDSGTRCILTLALELAETGSRYGCVGICVGSGQGVALVIENANVE